MLLWWAVGCCAGLALRLLGAHPEPAAGVERDLVLGHGGILAECWFVGGVVLQPDHGAGRWPAQRAALCGSGVGARLGARQLQIRGRMRRPVVVGVALATNWETPARPAGPEALGQRRAGLALQRIARHRLSLVGATPSHHDAAFGPRLMFFAHRSVIMFRVHYVATLTILEEIGREQGPTDDVHEAVGRHQIGRDDRHRVDQHELSALEALCFEAQRLVARRQRLQRERRARRQLPIEVDAVRDEVGAQEIDQEGAIRVQLVEQLGRRRAERLLVGRQHRGGRGAGGLESLVKRGIIGQLEQLAHGRTHLAHQLLQTGRGRRPERAVDQVHNCVRRIELVGLLEGVRVAGQHVGSVHDELEFVGRHHQRHLMLVEVGAAASRRRRLIGLRWPRRHAADAQRGARERERQPTGRLAGGLIIWGSERVARGHHELAGHVAQQEAGRLPGPRLQQLEVVAGRQQEQRLVRGHEQRELGHPIELAHDCTRLGAGQQIAELAQFVLTHELDYVVELLHVLWMLVVRRRDPVDESARARELARRVGRQRSGANRHQLVVGLLLVEARLQCGGVPFCAMASERFN